jgi:DNA repair exonuclease SbcCD ATPase subunit
MITSVTDELAADFANADQLPEQNSRLEEAWARVQRELQTAQDSIRERLSVKREPADALTHSEQRLAEIGINLGRFEQLEQVYRSDIERLEAIEEAGFLLALGGDKDCPLCGAPPEAQRHAHALRDIEAARDAARAEIDKIRRQRLDLGGTVQELHTESVARTRRLAELEEALRSLEAELSELAPMADVAERRVEDPIANPVVIPMM